MTSTELQKRLKEFACRILPLCDSMPQKKISRVMEEVQSIKSFTAKLNLIVKETDERTRILASSGKTSPHKHANIKS